MLDLYDDQAHLVDSARSALAKNRSVLCVLPTGGGKCLARGTKILLHNGETKNVEDVCAGDILMGPDSRPRNVLSITRGREEMFRVTPVKGDAWECNASHILSIVNSATNQIHDISVRDFLKRSKDFRRLAKQYRVGVNFDYKPVGFDPYMVGLYLAEGSHDRPMITTPEPEIIEYCHAWAYINDLKVRNEAGRGCSHLHFSSYKSGWGKNVCSNMRRYICGKDFRFIPKEYLRNDRGVRLRLLAGLLDGDGYLHRTGYEIITKYDKLRDDILYLARSLGLAAYSSVKIATIKSIDFTGKYHRIKISGDCSEIPCKVPRKKASPRKQIKSVLRTGFQLKSIGVGDYYGFEIDGDRRFLLGDFTVTHNTVIFSYITSRVISSGKSILILAHRDELLTQISETLKKFNVDHGFISAKHPYFPGKQVYVGSVFTAVRRLTKLPKFDLIITDEAHHLRKNSTWDKVIAAYPTAYSMGFTATPCRLSGEPLGDCYKSMVVGPSVADLISLNRLCDFKVYAPSQVDMSNVKMVGGDFNKKQMAKAVGESVIVGDSIAHYKKLIPGKSAVAFCVSVDAAIDTAKNFEQAGIKSSAVYGDQDYNERVNTIARFKRGDISVLTNCGIVTEGFDLPNLDAVIMLRPTASLSLYMQMVGRALRVFAGKTSATILDHVGNTERHGFVDESREWSLDGSMKSKKGVQTLGVRICPSCFAAVRAGSPACKYCGTVFPASPRVITQVDGDLQELDRNREKFIKIQENKNAKTMEELILLGQARGYKSPERWAGYIIAARNANAKA